MLFRCIEPQTDMGRILCFCVPVIYCTALCKGQHQDDWFTIAAQSTSGQRRRRAKYFISHPFKTKVFEMDVYRFTDGV